MQRMQICKAQNVPDIPSELLNCASEQSHLWYRADLSKSFRRILIIGVISCFSKEFRRHLESSDRRSWKAPNNYTACYHYFPGWNSFWSLAFLNENWSLHYQLNSSASRRNSAVIWKILTREAEKHKITTLLSLFDIYLVFFNFSRLKWVWNSFWSLAFLSKWKLKFAFLW